MIALRTNWSNLVNHTVPSEAGVVDNNVDLALAKLGRLLHKLAKVVVIEHVTRYRKGRTPGGVNVICDLLRFA